MNICPGFVAVGPVEVAPPQVSLPLSDSEVEIVGVQENTRLGKTPLTLFLPTYLTWLSTNSFLLIYPSFINFLISRFIFYFLGIV